MLKRSHLMKLLQLESDKVCEKDANSFTERIRTNGFLQVDYGEYTKIAVSSLKKLSKSNLQPKGFLPILRNKLQLWLNF